MRSFITIASLVFSFLILSIILSHIWRLYHQQFRFYKDTKMGPMRFRIPFWPVGKIQWVPDPKFGEIFADELIDNKVDVSSIILSNIWKP